MKHILVILFSIVTLSAFGQAGSLSQSVYRSRVNDSTTVNGSHTTGYADIYYNQQKKQWRFWDHSGSDSSYQEFASKTYVQAAVAAGGGGVTAPGSTGNVPFKSAGGGFQAETEFNYDSATNTLDADIVTVNDDAYAVGWNGSTAVPTKNAVYDKIEALASAFTYTDVIYVDVNGSNSTGTIGRIDKPFQTIEAALDAGSAVTNLKIQLGMGTYAAPPAAKLRANLWLSGSGKPGYNWTVTSASFGATTITSPTALKGGTIITGTLDFIDKGNVKITNLGVDNGSAYVGGGGTAGNCIGFGSATTTPTFTLMTNVIIQNVTTLGSSASAAFHGVVVENTFEALIDNVDTYWQTHGIVLKGNGGVVSNVRANNHTTSGIFIRSNTYAYSLNTRVENFEIFGLGGLKIESASQAGSQISIYDGHIWGTTFGVQLSSSGGVVNDAVHIDNVRVTATTGIGFDIDGSGFTYVTNCINRLSTGVGFKGRGTSGQIGQYFINCQSVQSGGNGFDVSATGTNSYIRLFNCTGSSATGYGFLLGAQVLVANLSGVNNSSGVVSGSIVTNQYGSHYFGTQGASTAVTPTALIQIAAGTATASTAPIKLTAGTNLTTPEAGAVEFDGTNYFVTSSTTRYTLAKTLTATASLNFDLTSGNSQDLTITVTGAADGDAVTVGVPNASATANVVYTWWTSGTNTVTVRASRIDVASGADPASGTFRASVIKY